MNSRVRRWLMLPVAVAVGAVPVWAATRQPIQTEIRAVSRLALGTERLVQEQEYECPMPPAPGPRALRVAVYEVESTQFLTEAFGLWTSCDEFPSSPHLDNSVFKARLLLRQRIEPPAPGPSGIGSFPGRGTFEGPWQLVRNGVEIGRGRIEGKLAAGSHDLFILNVVPGGGTFATTTFEQCDAGTHFEGLMKGALDFPAASGAGKDRRFSATVQGFGLIARPGQPGGFGMRIEGDVEVPCLNQPL
jgi:hypothetical protein